MYPSQLFASIMLNFLSFSFKFIKHEFARVGKIHEIVDTYYVSLF